MALNFDPEAKWPPAPYDEMLRSMQTWTAWWSGNTQRIADIYSNKVNYRERKYGHDAATLNQAPDVFFWGRPNPQGTKRRHVSVPASVARASAGLLFSTPPRIAPGPEDIDNTELVDRMGDIFGPDAYGGELISAGEMCSALGGVYLRPWWDKEVVNHVVPSHVPADRAVPEFRMDRLVAVTFWTIVSKPGDSPVLRHLERHEKGRIIHGLYQGTENTLGSKIGLENSPATSWIVPSKLSEAGDDADSYEGEVDDSEGIIETGIDQLDVVYVPNVLPNREWHNTPGLAQLGRSDFDGIEGEFDALDEVQTSWMRDVEDAKSRIFIDETLIEDKGPGKGGTYDGDQHVYVTTRGGLGSGAEAGEPITSVKFDIRYMEHAQTKAEIKQHILDHVGIASQYFADGPLAVGVTATEVNSRNSITETTRGAKITYWQRALTEFVEIVMKLDAIHFRTELAITDRPTVRFTAQHTQSDQEVSATIQSNRASGVMSQKRGVEVANPDWTDAEVLEELKEIREDSVRESRVMFGSFEGGPDDPAVQEGKLEDVTIVEGLEGEEEEGDDVVEQAFGPVSETSL